MDLIEEIGNEIRRAEELYLVEIDQAIRILKDAEISWQRHRTVNELGVLQATGARVDARAGALGQAVRFRDIFREHKAEGAAAKFSPSSTI